jgi:hypothetical protein
MPSFAAGQMMEAEVRAQTGTERGDELVRAMGSSGVFKSDVSRRIVSVVPLTPNVISTQPCQV